MILILLISVSEKISLERKELFTIPRSLIWKDDKKLSMFGNRVVQNLLNTKLDETVGQ